MTDGEMVGWHPQLSGHDVSKLRETVKDTVAWCGAVHGSHRIRHNRATKQQQNSVFSLFPHLPLPLIY